MYDEPAAVPEVAPLVLLHPTDVYPVFGVIVPNVTEQLVVDVTLHVSPDGDTELTLEPFAYVT